MTNTEQAMFKVAKNISELSDHPRFKIGAAVVRKRRVISTGANSITKCSAVQAKLDAIRFSTYSPGKVHAEVQALSYLIKNRVDLRRAELYVYRETKDGQPAPSRPCPSCMALIKRAGIKRIHYSTYDGFACEDII